MDRELAILLDSTKAQSVISFLEDFEQSRSCVWKAVGARENNLATINLGSDPAAGLTERITNAIDAVLEREWLDRAQATGMRTPREAVASWFNIPDGRLSNIDNSRESGIQGQSRKVLVTLLESGDPAKPTVDIRDKGVGLLAEEFGSTILSLNENRKLRKLFLAGAFGQGGSTALSYSPYTIIVSRKFNDSRSVVAATIVRFNKGNLQEDKHGLYEYLVDAGTGHPFSFSIEDSEFEAGTLVRQVAMDLGKYKQAMTQLTSSLWYLTHHYLFDPVFPIRIEEQRGNSSKGENRFVGGNARRLNLGDFVEHKRDATRVFRDGEIKLNWWVLSANGDDARNRINQFTLVSKPILITFNGQKQGELPNTIIKNDLKLPYLERYVIAQVDCDRLDNESRRQLFPTTRESLRDTSILEDLRQIVVETLLEDERLPELDRQRKDRYLRRTDSTSVENLRRRLARRVEQFVGAGGTGSVPTPPKRPPAAPSAPREPIPVQEPPTFIEITGTEVKHVYTGKNFKVKFKTDANPTYFDDGNSFTVIMTPPSFGRYTGVCSVRDGYGTAFFSTSPDLEVGTQAEIILELRPPRTRTISAQTRVEVVAEPETSGSQAGSQPTPNINPVWVGKEDNYWLDHNWDVQTVAAVEEGEDSVDVYVSRDNQKLSKLLERAQRRDTAAVENLRDFYLEHVAFHAVLSKLSNDKLASETGGEAINAEQLDELLGQEMKRVCETVCGIAESLFELLVTNGTATGQG